VIGLIAIVVSLRAVAWCAELFDGLQREPAMLRSGQLVVLGSGALATATAPATFDHLQYQPNLR
jgi:hypothetical protein